MKKCIEMQKDKFIDDAIQQIGVDIGQGFLKAYSQFEGEVYQCMFKSIIGLGRKIKFDDYENPIYINVNNDKGSYFVGEFNSINLLKTKSHSIFKTCKNLIDNSIDIRINISI